MKRNTGSCGWCITGDHDHCIVLVECNTKGKAIPYPWRCPCECPRSFETKCFDCQRVGVETRQNRCIDTEACKTAERPKQPKVREGTCNER